MNRFAECDQCECNSCVFDYGIAVCSEFGGMLCSNIVNGPCDTCRKAGAACVVHDCQNYQPEEVPHAEP